VLDRTAAAATLGRATRLARPSTLRSLAREGVWRVRRRTISPIARPTWQPDERLLASATIVWPDHYSWPAQAARVEPIRLGFEALAPVRRAELFSGVPEGTIGLVPFAVEVGGRQLSVVIDYGDETAVDPRVIETYDVVFKMQYRVEGYGSDRVVPGGYVPPDGGRLLPIRQG
jgi:hypothetical protein